ncbi:hypothetical protein [Streptomyces fuscigenes]|uniref:hypothetical protein n=1 Tax=Streptomyces fuscigenes TaxID=1528880 RepID=UPI001F405AF7|nr:hypothetical protein [Streptomyces fuscigenes]MCF3962594.1 hypothetical protein [Streptomyces fuscigenes]
MDSGFPPGTARQVAAAGRVPLAVAVVDCDGLVSHWSAGARRLFGHTAREATGCQAADLMPVAGGLAVEESGVAHGCEPSAAALPTAGRAAVRSPEGARADVLWWAYPLRPAGHLVLAADARRLARGGARPASRGPRVMPGFARPAQFPDAPRLAALLPHLLQEVGRADAGRITERVLELGYPVLEFSQCHQVPVTPLRYWPQQPARTACGSRAASR